MSTRREKHLFYRETHHIKLNGNNKRKFFQSNLPKQPIEQGLMKLKKEITLKSKEIIKAFNLKPKDGIQRIKSLCLANNIKTIETEIAAFLHQQKMNLNLETVGDYLSSPDAENQAVLKAFTNQIDFKKQSFAQSLRYFLSTFKLPGEAQKIDRLVESFSKVYYQQNLQSQIANQDAAYILAFQTIMLNTDLHNPNIAEKNKMSFSALKKNLRGCNNKHDFDENFLKTLFDDIKNHPLELNFIKIEPGFVITSRTLYCENTFKKLNRLLQDPDKKIQDFLKGVSNNIKATINQPKSWLSVFTGYNGTLVLSNGTVDLATIQVYIPGFFAWLFGKQAKVVIQPACSNGELTQEAIDLSARIAASFRAPVTSIKSTYDYEKNDLKNAYELEKQRLISNRMLQKNFSLWKCCEELIEADQSISVTLTTESTLIIRT